MPLKHINALKIEKNDEKFVKGENMKDYGLIKYVAKISGAKPKRSKTFLFCYFPYGDDALLTTYFTFEKRQSTSVIFDLEDIYESYGKKLYPSCGALVKAVVAKWQFFDIIEVDSSLHIISDLRVNRVEHACSQALTSVSVMINCLNELLHLNADNFSEEEWRDLHRSYLAHQKKNSKILSFTGLGTFVLNIALFIGGGITDSDTLTILSLLLCPLLVLGGLSVMIFFGIKFCYYKSELRKSVNAKKFH